MFARAEAPAAGASEAIQDVFSPNGLAHMVEQMQEHQHGKAEPSTALANGKLLKPGPSARCYTYLRIARHARLYGRGLNAEVAKLADALA